MSNPKLNLKEESSAKKTRSPPKKAKVEQSVPRKKKLKTDAEKTAEKAQHLRFGKAELTPDELSRLSKAQKREMYAAHAARSAVHREVDQYEDDNVGTQALSEGEKAAGNIRDISKSRYARKLKKKAKMKGKKSARTAKSSVQKPTSAQDAGASGPSVFGRDFPLPKVISSPNLECSDVSFEKNILECDAASTASKLSFISFFIAIRLVIAR